MSEQGSSAARVAGKIHKHIEVAGRKFLLSQTPPVEMIPEIEAFILGQRPDLSSFAIATARNIPAKMQPAVFQGAAMAYAAMGESPTPEEWDRFDKSLWRPAFLFWKMLDKRHLEEFPDVESVYRLFQQDAGDFDTLIAMVRRLSRDDELKNSDGRHATAEAAPNLATGNLSSVDGQPSMSTSPSGSTGANAT